MVVGFRLAVRDSIEAEEIMDPLAELRHGIVRHDSNESTVIALSVVLRPLVEHRQSWV